MEEGIELMAHPSTFNNLVRNMFNAGGKIEEEDQACLFITSLPKSYDSTTMSFLGKKCDLTMLKVTIILLNSKSLRQHEEDVSESSSAIVTALDWRRRKRLGRGTCYKYGKPNHFRQDCPQRRLYCPPTPRADRAAVAIDDDNDVICVYG
jgi:gag-polypeptide of LTR copia-type